MAQRKVWALIIVHDGVTTDWLHPNQSGGPIVWAARFREKLVCEKVICLRESLAFLSLGFPWQE